MNARGRNVVFLLACLAMSPAVILLIMNIPRFGAHPQPYGDAINARGPRQRHVANMVSAVNFDYRGIDTLGEEFMLVCAVTGVVVLLRSKRGEQADAPPGAVQGRPLRPRSDAALAMVRVFAPVTAVFGVYTALHGMTTPGGGFQGGVIIASAALLVFLGEGYRSWRNTVRSTLCDACEGTGATLYALCGFASLFAGAPFLTNVLPLGRFRDVFSGGLMLIENAGVALAVAGGFLVLFGEFLEETRMEQPDDEPG